MTNVEIDTDVPPVSPVHRELNLTAGCWLKLCMYLTNIICLYNY